MDKFAKKALSLVGIRPPRLVRRMPILPPGALFPLDNQRKERVEGTLAGASILCVAAGASTESQPINNMIRVAGGKILDSSSDRCSGIVLDARGVRSVHELTSLFTALRPRLPLLDRNGRLVVVSATQAGTSSGKPKDAVIAASSSSVAEAIHGFTKSVAKEIAHKGATANTLQLLTDASHGYSGFAGPLQFLLSSRSAFVTGQRIFVSPQSAAVPSTSETDLFNVSGKKILITGASRGIGECIARLLYAEGADLILLDHPAALQSLGETAEMLDAKLISLDVSDQDAPSTLLHFLQNSLGIDRLDAVVHNAGITRDKTFKNMSEANFQAVINVNLESISRMDELLYGNLLQPGSKAVYMSSISGIAGTFGQTNYSCSKAGVIGYVNGLAAASGAHGVGVNAIAPGFIETEMTAKIPFIKRTVGRYMNSLLQEGYPVDIAESVLFFTSCASDCVQGSTLRVCGGHIIGQ
jgi:3-oxoacyl-[acyl-carrier protein] reductase